MGVAVLDPVFGLLVSRAANSGMQSYEARSTRNEPYKENKTSFFSRVINWLGRAGFDGCPPGCSHDVAADIWRPNDAIGVPPKAMKRTDRDPGLNAAIDAVGGLKALGRLLGLTHQTIGEWQRVPAERVRQIEGHTGVPRHVLRPDLYDEK